jgi:hypothetical protein
VEPNGLLGQQISVGRLQLLSYGHRELSHMLRFLILLNGGRTIITIF